jgi:triacylglycerol lipase
VWAHVLPAPLIRQLRPGSALLQELAEPAPGCSTRITAIYSDIDQVVVPTRSGRCDHPDLGARNVLVRGVGHLSMPIHRVVVDEVAATLAGLRRPSADVAPPAAVA